MKTGKTLMELAQEIERRAGAKQDLVASTKIMEMIPNDAGGVRLGVNGDADFGVNVIGHQQIGDHTGIPRKYYERMREEAPALLADNVNEWFRKYPTDRMVRTLDGNARAFLSDRFRPLENEELAEAILPVLGDLGVKVLSSEITDRRLYIKVVDQRIEMDVPTGKAIGDGSHAFFDTCSPAMTISNSEVGMGSLAIDTSIYTRMCTNMATIDAAGSLKKYHIGGKHEITGEGGWSFLSDQTRRAKDKALWLEVRDVVKGAFEETRFRALINDTLIGMPEQKITGDVVKVVDLSAKAFSMTDGEKGSVLKHLIAGGDLSRYGLFNAITRTAEDLDDYDRATEFERMGGKVISLPRHDWERMAEAA